MSSTYLDVIKNRLYIEKADSKERRAAQTTMYYILDSLVKILTPMISFTVEEMWRAMKHTKAEDVESPMLVDYPVVNEDWDDEKLIAKWKKIIELRSVIAKELELARAEKVIGNSLDAKVLLKASKNEFKFLKENEDLIKEVLIISQLEVEEADGKLSIEVAHADGEKCERCWSYSTDIKDGLCPHCREILK